MKTEYEIVKIRNGHWEVRDSGAVVSQHSMQDGAERMVESLTANDKDMNVPSKNTDKYSELEELFALIFDTGFKYGQKSCKKEDLYRSNLLSDMQMVRLKFKQFITSQEQKIREESISAFSKWCSKEPLRPIITFESIVEYLDELEIKQLSK